MSPSPASLRGIFVRALGLALLLSSRAVADNQVIDWLDRVTHDVQREEGPLSTRPVDFHVYGGVYAYYTDNLYLAPNRHADGDSAGMAFGRATIDYAGTELELSADVMASFDYYMEHHEAREDEERAYGKVRWTNTVFDLQVAAIARREYDVLDAVFTRRARRIITDTFPRASVKIPDLPKVEAFAQIETVRYEGDDLDGQENESYRGGLSVLADVTQRFGVGADVGLLYIRYREHELTPNARGWFARGIARGELTERLLVEAALGWTLIHGSKEEFGDDKAERYQTMDAEFHVRYEATETLALSADYSRRFGFAGFGNTFETIDRAVVMAEWQVMEKLKLRARGQYNHVEPSESNTRSYWSGFLGATFQVFENLALDAGVTYRGGNTRKITGDGWDNWNGYVGAVVSF